MKELTHFINGAQVKGTSGDFGDVYNPATGEVQAKLPLANPAEVSKAVEDAAEAQIAWGATNPQKRARVMMKMVALMNRDMDVLAEALSREHGKTIPDAKGDLQRGLEVIEYCVGAPQMLKGEYTDDAGPGIDMYSMRQPLGVVASIMPFNFPAMMPLWHVGPALACGNAVVLKPSEPDPSVPLLLAELFVEAGLPKGVFQVVNGTKEAVDTLLDHEIIQGVSFVGSTPIAQYIYSRATAASFALFLILHNRYGTGNHVTLITFIALVGAVAWARIWLKRHTLLELLSGGLIGFFSLYLVLSKS